MGARTAIEWTDATWNPVTGCTAISPGCDRCYAESIARRFAGTPAFPHGFQVHPLRLSQPLAWTRPRRIFTCSMGDLFHARVPFDFIDQVFSIIEQTPRHTYQVLTKRAERMRRWADSRGWPPNAWAGVSVERAQESGRLNHLVRIQAPVRFVSAEPLIASLQLRPWLPALDWVIVGGESGAGARPMRQAWVDEIRLDCEHAGTPFFFKQWGPKRRGRMLHGRTWDDLPAGEPRPDWRTVPGMPMDGCAVVPRADAGSIPVGHPTATEGAA